jgi:O-antigen ligase
VLGKLYLNNAEQILLIALIFLLPISTFATNITSVLILLLWLFTGNFKEKFSQIRSSKLVMAAIIFFGLHVIGLLWTEDLHWGAKIIKKMLDFALLLPILFVMVKKEYIKHYVSAFLLAITISEFYSYLIWFEVMAPFGHATVNDPTPFVFHVIYNPLLAFAIYLLAYEIRFNQQSSKIRRYFSLFLFFTMSINMFITGGRAGQVGYFVLLVLFIFQCFRLQKMKAFLISLLIIPVIFFSAYNASDLFKNRVEMVVTNLVSYSEHQNDSSVGQRITYILNSWEIISENPILGVGTGDFKTEYTAVNDRNHSVVTNLHNPHNMYILVLVQLGLVGLISLFSLFYYQIKFSLTASSQFSRDIGLALPVFFLVVMWSESYLLLHHTTVLFIFFSSFLYKDFEYKSSQI